MITEIWGITPDAMVFLKNISPNPLNASIPSSILAPPESFMLMNGAPIFIAISITFVIFFACISPREPPITVKSCDETYTRRPFTVP